MTCARPTYIERGTDLLELYTGVEVVLVLVVLVGVEAEVEVVLVLVVLVGVEVGVEVVLVLVVLVGVGRTDSRLKISTRDSFFK